ncbi:hypothetical protein GCM10028810_00040 [Spirosoma litoris]
MVVVGVARIDWQIIGWHYDNVPFSNSVNDAFSAFWGVAKFALHFFIKLTQYPLGCIKFNV